MYEENLTKFRFPFFFSFFPFVDLLLTICFVGRQIPGHCNVRHHRQAIHRRAGVPHPARLRGAHDAAHDL